MSELIRKQDAVDAAIKADMENHNGILSEKRARVLEEHIAILPPVRPESCEGCKHLGKWENEVEYGYPSPCTRCKRRAEDHYER